MAATASFVPVSIAIVGVRRLPTPKPVTAATLAPMKATTASRMGKSTWGRRYFEWRFRGLNMNDIRAFVKPVLAFAVTIACAHPGTAVQTSLSGDE
jgi:hypothetical protein